MIAAACPGCQEFERYLLGESSAEESSRFEAHLAQCDRCLESFDAQAAQDPLALALRQLPPDPENGEELDRLIARLRRFPATGPTPPDGETLVATSSEPPNRGDTEVVYDFLTPPQSPDELGRLGPYRVLEVLGAGGMGVVFRAEDPHLKRIIALKAMKRSVGAGESARKRFLREAQSVAALEHDHIVPVYQAGEDRGVLYLAMPLLKGESLDARLKREGRLPVAEALRIARESAEGLASAHANGLVHRDIKPANIWLEAGRGRVKLLDFGLARATVDDASLTQSGTIAGTPQYMSPEQARGGTIAPRCDLFSLGCVLYHMLTGQPPFRGSDAIATLMAVATDDPVPLPEVEPAVPRPVSDLVLRLLAKAPEGRPESAEAAARAIAALEQDLAAPPPPRRRRRTGVLLAAAAVPLLLLAAFVIALKTDRGTLVLTVNEPDVRVIVDGGARHVTITSPRDSVAIDLAPGRHSLRVIKDGFETVTREFKIVRGGKEEIIAHLEPLEIAPAAGPKPPPNGPVPTVQPPPPVPLADQARPFVVLRATDRRRDAFKHLAVAIAQLEEGDAIEVHGNGPFHVPSIRLERKGLTLRAAPGYRPRFVAARVTRGSVWFGVLDAPLRVEGCDFVSEQTHVFGGARSLCEIVNCRILIWGGTAIGCVSGKLRVTDCLIANEGPGAVLTLEGRGDAELSNNLIRGGWDHPCPAFFLGPGDGGIHLRLRRNTIIINGLLYVQNPTDGGKVVLESTENLFWNRGNFAAVDAARARIKDVLSWQGRDNLYSNRSKDDAFLYKRDGEKLEHLPRNGLAGWQEFWGDAEAGGREVPEVSFRWSQVYRATPDAALAILRRETEAVRKTTRLETLGPDWDLVGTGDAYLRALAAAGRAVPRDRLRPEPDEGGPFVIVREGRGDDGHPSLQQAVDASADGDAIEIRADGPFDAVTVSARPEGLKSLTIRAAPGYRPVLRGRFAILEGNVLAFEGIEFRGASLAGRVVRLLNCSMMEGSDPSSPSEINQQVQSYPAGRGPFLEIVNCLLRGPGEGAVQIYPFPLKGLLSIRNSVVGRVFARLRDEGEPAVSMDHCVVWDAGLSGDILAFEGSGTRAVSVSARDTLFELSGSGSLLHLDATDDKVKLAAWDGARNVYRLGGPRWLSRSYGPSYHQVGTLSLPDLDAWRAHWGTKEEGSVVADPLFSDPMQWRLVPDTPGYRAAKDGGDLGADVARIARPAITKVITD